jgi:urease accessory protein
LAETRAAAIIARRSGVLMKALLAALALVLAPSVAAAHVGIGDTNSIAHGFMHPLSGVDHVLAMLAVGLFAAHLGGRALWLLPLSFVAMMACGGVLGMAGIGVPYVEIAIGLSVVVLGIVVAMRVNPPMGIAAALVGFFAIFHGHAHGTEMPETASGLAYGAGFVIATALLHVIGVGIGTWIGEAGRRYSRTISQIAGGAMALAGIAILGGLI